MKQPIILFLVIIATVQTAKIPSNFQKCNRKQPDLNKCLAEASQSALGQLTKPIKALNVPSLKPYFLPKLEIPAGNGPVGVDQKFKNCNLYGFAQVEVENFDLDLEKRTLDLKGVFPEIRKNCEYDLDGRILLLPVQGQGLSEIILKNVQVTAHLTYNEIPKNGKIYARFVTCKVNLNPENVSFKFDNLFNGDKILGDNINQVINENWKDVFGDVKNGYEEAIEQIFMALLNGFFSKVSMEEALD